MCRHGACRACHRQLVSKLELNVCRDFVYGRFGLNVDTFFFLWLLENFEIVSLECIVLCLTWGVFFLKKQIFKYHWRWYAVVAIIKIR